MGRMLVVRVAVVRSGERLAVREPVLSGKGRYSRELPKVRRLAILWMAGRRAFGGFQETFWKR